MNGITLTWTLQRMTHANADRRAALWALVLAFTLVYVCWGTTYLALKVGVQEQGLPPALFGGSRITIAGLLLFGWQALCCQPLLVQRSDLLTLSLCALLLFVGGNGLINVAGQTLDSGICAVLVATTPLFVGLFELCWPLGDRLTLRGWLGLIVGLAGILLLSMPKFQESTDLTANIGVFAALGSAGCWALGSLVTRFHRVACSHLTAAAYQMILGGVGLMAIGICCGELGRMPEKITQPAVVAYVWLLVAGSLVGFVAYNWLLLHVSVTHVGTYAYVNPAIAVVIGVSVGEEASAWLVGGIVVILLSIGLVRGGLRPAARR